MRVLPGARAIDLDPLRAYTDMEVRELLGNIGRTTLWELRRRKRSDGVTPLLQSISLYPGGPRRTTAAQLLSYIAYLDESSSRVTGIEDRRHRGQLREASAS